MYLYKHIFLICSALLLVNSLPVGDLKAKEIISKVQASDMILLGQLGNKFFFRSTNETANGNWKTLIPRCQNAGLKPLIIASSAEFDFVHRHLLPINPNVGHWVDARLKNSFKDWEMGKNFEWTDGTDVDMPGVNFHHGSWRWLCVYFQMQILYSDLCVGNTTSRPVLCQLSLTENFRY